MSVTYLTPKENWIAGNAIGLTDMNRIEGNIDYLRTQNSVLYGKKIFVDSFTIGTGSGSETPRNNIDYALGGFGDPASWDTDSNGDKINIWNNGINLDTRIGMSLTDSLWIKSMGNATPNVFALFGSILNSGNPNRLFTVDKSGNTTIVGLTTTNTLTVTGGITQTTGVTSLRATTIYNGLTMIGSIANVVLNPNGASLEFQRAGSSIIYSSHATGSLSLGVIANTNLIELTSSQIVNINGVTMIGGAVYDGSSSLQINGTTTTKGLLLSNGLASGGSIILESAGFNGHRIQNVSGELRITNANTNTIDMVIDALGDIYTKSLVVDNGLASGGSIILTSTGFNGHRIQNISGELRITNANTNTIDMVIDASGDTFFNGAINPTTTPVYSLTPDISTDTTDNYIIPRGVWDIKGYIIQGSTGNFFTNIQRFIDGSWTTVASISRSVVGTSSAMLGQSIFSPGTTAGEGSLRLFTSGNSAGVTYGYAKLLKF